jgi:hypothetical protein
MVRSGRPILAQPVARHAGSDKSRMRVLEPCLANARWGAGGCEGRMISSLADGCACLVDVAGRVAISNIKALGRPSSSDVVYVCPFETFKTRSISQSTERDVNPIVAHQDERPYRSIDYWPV